MAHELVEQGRPELHIRQVAVAQRREHLLQAEQIEVIDQESREKHDGPAEPEHAHQGDAAGVAGDVPDRRSDRPPLPVEQQEQEARHEYVGAALGLFGNDPRPPALESGPRHHAVLDCKYAEEERVNDERLDEGPAAARVDRFRHDQIADEADGVKERHEKYRVACDAVQKDERASEHG